MVQILITTYIYIGPNEIREDSISEIVYSTDRKI